MININNSKLLIDAYVTVFHRTPDIIGYYNYLQKINNGTSISSLINVFSSSIEYRTVSRPEFPKKYLTSKIYMIITDLSYPMGGGEDFMMDTINIANNLGFGCVWISFRDCIHGTYDNDIINVTEQYIDHRVSKNVLTSLVVKFAIDVYKPFMIHIQGRVNSYIPNLISKYSVPCLIGYHFWSNLVDISGLNRDILENIDKHSLVRAEIEKNDLFTVYVVSDFMKEVVNNIEKKSTIRRKINHIIYPIPAENHYKTECDIIKNKHILMMNIHVYKGGDILYDILNEIKDIPFILVRSEPNSDAFDEKIERLAKDNPLIEIHRYIKDPRELYKRARLVLIPTHVDETFCRVAYESASNGIPVLTTGRGYVHKMLEGSGVFLSENSKDWVDKIRELYNNEKELKSISEKSRISAGKYSFNIIESMLKSRINRIGIFCPWGDQGLGIQSRTYAKILRDSGFSVFIFSYRSYFSGNKLKFQHNENEWKLYYGDIFYSVYTREYVPREEIHDFVRKYSIDTFLIPEICWDPIFIKIQYMKELNVKIIAIPNVEIIIKSELSRYKIFDKIFANTKICKTILNEYGISSSYIGHTIEKIIPGEKPDISAGIRFLHVSGTNAIIRKQTDKVVSSFLKALESVDNIYLTITVNGDIPKELREIREISHKNITINNHKMSYTDILKLYSHHHISIQVSSHEGLGIGFYESIAHGVPVISLDTPPHNEIIVNNISGWLLPCTYEPLPDNKDPVIDNALFKIENLTELIIKISKNIDEISKLSESSRKFYEDNFNNTKFSERLIPLL